MKPLRIVGVAAVLAAATMGSNPARACLPPPPGSIEPRPPSVGEIAGAVAGGSSDIAYGVILSELGTEIRFKVLHVYKGRLTAGRIIRPRLAHPITRTPPVCPGMISPTPLPRGAYGVIAFDGQPELRFVEDVIVDEMIAARLIRSARTKKGIASAPGR